MLVNMNYPKKHQMPVTAKQKGVKGPSKQPIRPAQSQPVDPQELTRRLYVVLAEQKVHSEQRRQARAEASKSRQQFSKSHPNRSHGPKLCGDVGRADYKLGYASASEPDRSSRQGDTSSRERSNHRGPKQSDTPSAQASEDGNDTKAGYRHIPQVAASQFARTTTVGTHVEKGPVHTLLKQVIKSHLDGLNASPTAKGNYSDAASCEMTVSLKRAQSMCERHYERNPINEPNLLYTGEPDMSLQPLGLHHSLQNKAQPGKSAGDDTKNSRRMSTGNLLGRLETHLVEPFELVAALLSSEKPETVGNPNEHHRVDWTQSDERATANAATQPSPSHLEFRKPETRWKLRGRLGSFGRHSKDDRLPTPPEETAAHDVQPKSPLSGFFSRFKR